VFIDPLSSNEEGDGYGVGEVGDEGLVELLFEAFFGRGAQVGGDGDSLGVLIGDAVVVEGVGCCGGASEEVGVGGGIACIPWCFGEWFDRGFECLGVDHQLPFLAIEHKRPNQSAIAIASRRVSCVVGHGVGREQGNKESNM
jgi:hypothetical protein